jgi:hypothetical protein
VEWTAVVLVAALALGGLAFAISRSDAWRLGDAILHAIACAAGEGCGDALQDAYGEELAATVRDYAPNIAYERRSAQLPVDFRRCRRTECSDGSDEPVEIHESSAGLQATAFTRVLDRRPKGGPLYLQYWLYFPESFSGGIGRTVEALGGSWPGAHADDWEGYQVRISPHGELAARATAHGSYDSPSWGRWTSWYRISGGSHAGQLVDGSAGERTTPSSALRLLPLESLNGTGQYRFAITPPWAKSVYSDPESGSS